jgi:hypothetical protein
MRAMTIRMKRNLLIFVAWPVGGALFGYLGFVIHDVVALMIFPWAFLIRRWTSRMRCPSCNVPVGWHRYKYGGEYWSPLTPKRCERCGHSLTETPETPGGPEDKDPRTPRTRTSTENNSR